MKALIIIMNRIGAQLFRVIVEKEISIIKLNEL